MSRAKGNSFERVVARQVCALDGIPPLVAKIASSTGRVGHLDLGCDIITTRFAWECKNREDIPRKLWDWLDHIDYPGPKPVVVIKRNGHRPLVVLGLDDFLDVVQGA